MLVLGIVLVILLVTLLEILAGTVPRLSREDLQRIRRLSERRQRDDSMPFV